ncbi:MAG: polyhydroxyalkanoic acid system family protein [Verrucomicrobiota bacterium]|nr:polyhydroxyalkanoic acid system family protein [Verrucomicrobiota bacterium]
MNRTISVTLPHRLTQDEVRAGLQAGIADLKTKFAGRIGEVQETWTGNTMNFRFAIMGQAVTGRVDILADALKLDIDLPWFLTMLADKIKPQVEREARRLLERK